MNRFRRGAWSDFFRAVATAAVLVGAVAPVRAGVVSPPSWSGASGSGGVGDWSTSGNWSPAVVPTSSLDATLPAGPTNRTINLGAAAVGKSLFPQADGYVLQSGTLTLADQLWLDETSGTTTIGLSSTGTNGTLSVTSPRVTIGAGSSSVANGVALLTGTGGSATLTATDSIVIGYDGDGNSLTANYDGSESQLVSAGGVASISAPSIWASVAADAGQDPEGWNWVGTYSAGSTLTTSNLVLGDAGDKGGAENYGGTWNVVDTTLGNAATASDNYLTIAGSGTFTNTGAFTVGVAGFANTVWVGDDGLREGVPTVTPTPGTLVVTGTSDVVVGFGAGATGNAIYVYEGSRFQAGKNIVVGVSGTGNQFVAIGGSTVVSEGLRVGVSVGASENIAGIGDATWDMTGSVRIGDAGSRNLFIVQGGTASLTGAGKNFYVGYADTASDNILGVVGAGSVLRVRDATADVVISANVVSGTVGSGATGNIALVADSGLIDATRVLVGSGGTLAGTDNGTVRSNVLVGTGGAIAPGDGTAGTIGGIAIDGNLDLAPSISPFFGQQGRLEIDISGTQVDMVSVTGLMNVAGATLRFAGTPTWAGVPYVFASYGTLSGTFGTVENMPGWMFIDYDYGGTNQIALVPEPSSLVLLGMGAACLAWQRRRRRTA